MTPAAVGVALVVALPGALTAYASFQSGGFFVGTPALLAVIVGIGLVVRITLAERPFAGFNRGVGIAVGALGLYCVWILLSASWSDAPARAMAEFDRALLYWLVLVLAGSLPRDDGRVAWALRGVALAILAVCTAALATRLFPDVFELAPAIADERLNYPLTYWNTLGLMAGIGLVLTLHMTSSEREPAPVRVLAAAGAPILVATIYFTFSRGGMVAAILGAAAYVLVARPRSLVVGLLAAGPPAAAALVSAYGADLLAGDRPATAAAAAQGGDVAVVVAACVAAAAALRTLGLPADERLRRVAVPAGVRRSARNAVLAGVAAALLAAVVVFDAGGAAVDGVERFTEQGTPSGTDDFRGRLVSARNNGRIEQWEVALEGFTDHPLRGDGAGVFYQRWNRDRPDDLQVVDAHSLYLETLSELGLVGGLLLLTALAAIVVAFARRARGERRHLYAALLGAGLAWAVHAGVDWDWEMPAVTLWLFALGGMALARAPAGPADGGSRGTGELASFPRVALGVGCLALLVTPALMALSQGQLNRAVSAFKRGDCAEAASAAVDAARLVSARPQPYQLLGYCDSRAGEHDLAVEMMETAIAREPGSWDAHYGLAVVRAAAGRDPRRAARTALELNPNEPLARYGMRRFRTDDPLKWRRRASNARLPIL